MPGEEKKVVIKAISDLGHRVTAADVASKTGLPLNETTGLLNTIASEAGGHLEVSEAGDIAYRFKNNFQSAYLATGIRALAGKIFDKIFALVFFLLKISFGIFLSLSLIIVVISFIVIALLSSHLGTDRDEFSLGELLDFFNFLIFRDLLFANVVDSQIEQRQNRLDARNRLEAANRLETERLENEKLETGEPLEATGKSKGNFFINCFSFLFGDGNPNVHLDDHKWQLAASAIRANGGVVIKEQLAPYIGPELDDEDSILPVLARFDGRPAVTTKGNIAYIFPSMQVTTEQVTTEQVTTEPVTTDTDHQVLQAHPGHPGEAAAAAGRQGYLQEELWKFSKLPTEALRPVYVVAGLNLFGTLWLYWIFNKMFHMPLAFTQILVAYGALFVIIPLVRLVWQSMLNHRIAIRNFERQEAAKIVSEADREIKGKLADLGEFESSVPIRAVEADHLAYTTERETLEQQLEEGK